MEVWSTLQVAGHLGCCGLRCVANSQSESPGNRFNYFDKRPQDEDADDLAHHHDSDGLHAEKHMMHNILQSMPRRIVIVTPQQSFLASAFPLQAFVETCRW